MKLTDLKLADYVECRPSLFGYPEEIKFGGFIVGYMTDNGSRCLKIIGNLYGEERIHQVYVVPNEVTEIVRRANPLPSSEEGQT